MSAREAYRLMRLYVDLMLLCVVIYVTIVSSRFLLFMFCFFDARSRRKIIVLECRLFALYLLWKMAKENSEKSGNDYDLTPINALAGFQTRVIKSVIQLSTSRNDEINSCVRYCDDKLEINGVDRKI